MSNDTLLLIVRWETPTRDVQGSRWWLRISCSLDRAQAHSCCMVHVCEVHRCRKGGSLALTLISSTPYVYHI